MYKRRENKMRAIRKIQTVGEEGKLLIAIEDDSEEEAIWKKYIK